METRFFSKKYGKFCKPASWLPIAAKFSMHLLASMINLLGNLQKFVRSSSNLNQDGNIESMDVMDLDPGILKLFDILYEWLMLHNLIAILI